MAANCVHAIMTTGMPSQECMSHMPSYDDCGSLMKLMISWPYCGNSIGQCKFKPERCDSHVFLEYLETFRHQEASKQSGKDDLAAYVATDRRTVLSASRAWGSRGRSFSAYLHVLRALPERAARHLVNAPHLRAAGAETACVSGEVEGGWGWQGVARDTVRGVRVHVMERCKVGRGCVSR
eukprot:6195857-Pleurochrysis_carterae.AAC.5